MGKAELRAARDEIHRLVESGTIQSYFGIELDGAGHYPLLLGTLRDLIAIGVTDVAQAKTKYGVLRVMLGAPSPAEARDIVNDAMVRSQTICIRCGEPGKLTDEFSWDAVLCATHYEAAKRTGRVLADFDDDDFGDRDTEISDAAGAQRNRETFESMGSDRAAFDQLDRRGIADGDQR